MSGILYIVATPIGNLEDITLRAIRILKEVDLIIAEDTRKTRILLNHYEIVRPLDSYHHHSSVDKRRGIYATLKSGKSIALVTDAGTPGISDPGNELIDFILSFDPEIKVISIPGPSSLTASLSVCGFKTSPFTFVGFLPKKGKRKVFKEVSNRCFVFYESPYRLIKTLQEIKEYFGGSTSVFILNEATKLYEKYYRDTVENLLTKLANEKIKGEIVVIVAERNKKGPDVD